MFDRSFVGALLLLAASTPQAGTNEMTVSQFIALADAAMSRIVPPLSDEARAIGHAVRNAKATVAQDLALEAQQGRIAAACPPADGAWFKPPELLEWMKHQPAESRQLTVHQAIRALIEKRFPCPK